MRLSAGPELGATSCGPCDGAHIRTQLRCHELRGKISCGSPMPRGERIARPAERAYLLGRRFFLLAAAVYDAAYSFRSRLARSALLPLYWSHAARVSAASQIRSR